MSPPVTGPQSFFLRDYLDPVTRPGQLFRMSLQVTCLGALIRGRNIARDDAVSSLVWLVKEVMVLVCLITNEAGLEHLKAVCARFLHCRVIISPFVLNTCLGGGLWGSARPTAETTGFLIFTCFSAPWSLFLFIFFYDTSCRGMESLLFLRDMELKKTITKQGGAAYL